MPRITAPPKEPFRPGRRESLVENLEEFTTFTNYLKSNNMKALINIMTQDPERIRKPLLNFIEGADAVLEAHNKLVDQADELLNNADDAAHASANQVQELQSELDQMTVAFEKQLAISTFLRDALATPAPATAVAEARVGKTTEIPEPELFTVLVNTHGVNKTALEGLLKFVDKRHMVYELTGVIDVRSRAVMPSVTDRDHPRRFTQSCTSAIAPDTVQLHV